MLGNNAQEHSLFGSELFSAGAEGRGTMGRRANGEETELL